MARFKLDENMPDAAASVLRESGHDVMSVHQQQMGGRPDQQVMEVCRQEGRVLVTLDLDFADIRAYPPDSCPGVIVLRLARQDTPAVVSVLSRLLTLFETESIERRLWIADESTVRIREET
jgi:predicted nuclease of predicted toxin-antitoxin system